MRLIILFLFVGISTIIYSQTDSIEYSLEYAADTLVVTDHPLSDQFYLRQNTVLVTRNSKELAGTFDDPSRVLYRHVGVSTGNDQANGIIYRGFPSELVQWSIHGAQIINPNHLSNAGTFSDRSSASAGGVLSIPFDVINNFGFYASPNNNNFPNALAGVANFDFDSRSNSFFKMGLLGVEAAFQGKGKFETKVHARYSTIGLLSAAGLELGDEEIKFYDLHVRLKLSESLSFVAQLGSNSNFHQIIEDPTMADELKDLQEIKYASQLGMAALVYDKTRWKHTLAFSSFFDERTCTADYPSNMFVGKDNCFSSFTSEERLISYYGNFDVKRNDKYLLEASLQSYFQFSTVDNIQFPINFIFLKPAIKQTWFLNKGSINLLLAPTYDSLTDEFTFEPALGLTREMNTGLLDINFSLTSQMLESDIYVNSSVAGVIGLERAKSINASLAWKGQIQEKNRILARAFFHYLYELPYNNSGISPVVNGYGINNTFLTNPQSYTSIGEARNIGFEFMYDRNFSGGMYMNVNTTLFDFTYKHDEAGYIDATNNYRFITNVNFSKSFSFSRDRDLTVNAAFHIRGGMLDRYESLVNPERLRSYQRVDLRIQYEFKRSVLALDIQNVLNRRNDAFHIYDPFLDEFLLKEQLGLIPILSWKRNFS